MSAYQFTEKRKRAWAFSLITAVWLGATLVIVRHLAPQVDTNTASARIALARYNTVLDEQQALMAQHQELSTEIRNTQFQVYQMYVVAELREKAKGIYRKNTPIETHSMRVSRVLELLLNAREELVAKQRNLVKIGEQVESCRNGNQDIQVN